MEPRTVTVDLRTELLRLGVREALAAYAHEAWSGWMRWLFALSARNDDGSVTIPPGLVARWERQMTTSYDALPEPERNSDRVEADRILALFE